MSFIVIHYTSSALHPLARSDNNLVLLTLTYCPVVLRQCVSKKTIKRWSEEAEEALQTCFETTDWEMLYEPAEEDINNMTDCIMD